MFQEAGSRNHELGIGNPLTYKFESILKINTNCVRRREKMVLIDRTQIVESMSYKNLDVWKLAKESSIEIHKISLTLPKFELFETGSQIRRSSKSIYSNVVEGYGRRRYKNDYLRFLIYAHASVDETRAHLEVLFETGSLKDEETFLKISMKLNTLGRKLYAFIKYIEKQNDV